MKIFMTELESFANGATNPWDIPALLENFEIVAIDRIQNPLLWYVLFLCICVFVHVCLCASVSLSLSLCIMMIRACVYVRACVRACVCDRDGMIFIGTL